MRSGFQQQKQAAGSQQPPRVFHRLFDVFGGVQNVVGQYKIVTVRLETLRLGIVFDVQAFVFDERKTSEPLAGLAKEPGRNVGEIEPRAIGGKQRQQVFGRAAGPGPDLQHPQLSPVGKIG